MKHWLLLMIAVFLWGCEDEEATPGETFYNFYEDSALIFPEEGADFIVTYGDGKNTVFEYDFTEDGVPDIEDALFKESILFEIDSSLNQFSYEDEELSAIAFYRQQCFCNFTFSKPIEKGIIRGVKLGNGRWAVDVDISIDDIESYQVEKDFSQIFTRQ